jgi:hypothetical protein
MNTLTPLIELLNTSDFDGAKDYLAQLQDTASEHRWVDFNGMVGRIQLMKAALHRELAVPQEPFSRGATDQQLRNQVLFAYRAEAKKRLGNCPAHDRATAIDRAAELLLFITQAMSATLPAQLRDPAQLQMIQATYKSAAFPREIAMKAPALEGYRDLVLELDLGL